MSRYPEVSQSPVSCGEYAESTTPKADEAQQGHYNDGYNPYPTQPTSTNPYDQRQSHYGQYGSQYSVQYEQNQYESNPNQPYHLSDPFQNPEIPSSYAPAPLHDPYEQQQPQEAYPLQETYSAIQTVPSPPQPVNDYLGATYNPYDDQPSHTPGLRPQSQFGGDSYNVRDDAMDAGDLPLLQRESAYTGTTILGSYESPYTGTTIPGGYEEVPDADDAQPETNIRYGRIPQRVPRRYKTLKKVELFHGNFVLDSAVPSKLLDMCALRNEREFTHMRYSAATCDPNDFKENGFTLRQLHYDPSRRTELFIVMTMYNEDEELFCRSMHGVIKNVAHLCKRDRSKTWGKDGWKKVVVCIVSDGRQKINSRTLSVIATMGAYQDGIAKVCILNDHSASINVE